ncbi:MAG TPA: hypothetical protein VFQ65_05735 [Kofleriaceae bacterium]|nr:hypothetical protein [Kofleriaceae bacterium]
MSDDRALPATDAVRATQLAIAARDAYATAGPGYAKRHAAAISWLVTRRAAATTPQE